jgi:hypothetical protein
VDLKRKKNLGLRVAATIFGIVAVGHLLRLFIGFDFVVGTLGVPEWASGLAVIVLGTLSVWLFTLSRE